MITYRPIAPLTVGSGTLRSVLAAMAAAAMAAASGTGSDLDGISRWVVDVMEAVGAPGARVSA